MHEICEIPSGHCTPVPQTHVRLVILPEQLHAHHGEDEDDDAQHKGQVGQRAHGVHHDGQDVVEWLPWLGKFEHTQQTEGAQHRESGDTFSQQLHQGEGHYKEIKTVPAILKIIRCEFRVERWIDNSVNYFTNDNSSFKVETVLSCRWIKMHSFLL